MGGGGIGEGKNQQCYQGTVRKKPVVTLEGRGQVAEIAVDLRLNSLKKGEACGLLRNREEFMFTMVSRGYGNRSLPIQSLTERRKDDDKGGL